MATVWSTRYVLTRGITKEDGVELTDDGYAIRDIGRYTDGNRLFLKLGKDAWTDEGLARVKARKVVANRLAAIAKERDRLMLTLASLDDGKGC